jgi:hypothetical protein
MMEALIGIMGVWGAVLAGLVLYMLGAVFVGMFIRAGGRDDYEKMA